MSVRARAIWLDGDEDPASYGLDPDELTCPNAENHERHPFGYSAWHEWARIKSKTHKQRKCPDCGKFAIWYAKTPASPEKEPTDG